MSQRWVITATVNTVALHGRVVSGRFIGDCENSGSVMFMSYDYSALEGRWQWYWLYGGGQEKIEAPQMLFLDEDWVRANRILSTSDKPIKTRIRRKKEQQMVLAL